MTAGYDFKFKIPISAAGAFSLRDAALLLIFRRSRVSKLFCIPASRANRRCYRVFQVCLAAQPPMQISAAVRNGAAVSVFLPLDKRMTAQPYTQNRRSCRSTCSLASSGAAVYTERVGGKLVPIRPSLPGLLSDSVRGKRTKQRESNTSYLQFELPAVLQSVVIGFFHLVDQSWVLLVILICHRRHLAGWVGGVSNYYDGERRICCRSES